MFEENLYYFSVLCNRKSLANGCQPRGVAVCDEFAQNFEAGMPMRLAQVTVRTVAE
jgi:hypothetical protein